MKKVAIVTDSTSGMTIEEAKAYGIEVIPMIFYIDGKEYREKQTLSEEEFIAHLKAQKTLSTTQLPPADITDTWDRLLEEYDEIVHIPMTKGLSGSYNTAVMLAEDYDGKVVVVDNQRISVSLRSSAIYARKLADQGFCAEEIKERLLKSALDVSIYVTVDTLEYLKRGGRVSALTATAGDVLHIRPIIGLLNGGLEACGKARGDKKAKKMIEERILADYKTMSEKFGEEKLELYIAHTGAPEKAAVWEADMKELFPGREITVTTLPMNVGCHVGPGAIGMGIVAN